MSQSFKKGVAGILVSTVGLLGLITTGVATANAAALTSVSDSQSSVKAVAVTNHDIQFTTPTGLTSGQTILVTFSAGTVINPSLTFSDVDVLVNGVQQTLAASPTGTTWGVVRTSATVLTLTNGTSAVTAGQTIRIKIGTNATNQSTGVYQVTNDSAGSQIYTIGGGTFADSGSVTVNLISNDTVAVTGTVNQSISFAILSATSTAFSNSIYFGTLAAGTPKFASSTNTAGDTANGSVAHVLTVGTNAPSGYTVTVQGQSLTSLQNPANVISPAGASSAAISSSTEMFGITATKSGGVNGTIASQFATANQFGYNSTATTSVTLASGTTPTATETYALKYLASVSALTSAGTYSASLVYVATANF